MTNKILTLENPLIIIAITVIIVVILFTQKGIVGKVLRKYFKLNTDEETIKFAKKVNKKQTLPHKKGLNNFKSDLIGGRPNDR